MCLDSRHGSTVYDVFGAGDRRGACGDQEREQICYFFWLCWASDGNAAERVHHDLAGTFIVGAVLTCDFLDETDRSIRFDPAGRHADNAYALGAHFLGQTLAVIGKRGLRCGIGKGSSGQWQLALYGGDVDDHAGTLLNHGRHQCAIQTDGREQDLLQRLVPFIVVKHGEATRRGRATTHHMHQDVEAATTHTD